MVLHGKLITSVIMEWVNSGYYFVMKFSIIQPCWREKGFLISDVSTYYLKTIIPNLPFHSYRNPLAVWKNVARIYLYTNNTVAIKINQTADNQQKRRGKNRKKGFIWLIFVTCSITHWQPYNLYTIKRLLGVSSE